MKILNKLKTEIYKDLYKLTDSKTCEECNKVVKFRILNVKKNKWLCSKCNYGNN